MACRHSLLSYMPEQVGHRTYKFGAPSSVEVEHSLTQDMISDYRLIVKQNYFGIGLKLNAKR